MKMKKTLLISLASIALLSGCSFFNELINPSDVVSVLESKKDSIPPVVRITSHTNGQLVSTNFAISGNVFETNALSNVFIRIDDGEFELLEVDDTYNWSKIIVYPTQGIHTNYVYALDASGNVSLTNFVWVNSSSTYPSVEIVSPPNLSVFNTPNISLIGFVGITGEFSIDNVRLVHNGITNIVDGTGGWTNNVVLSVGTNTFTAVAYANNGSVTSSPEWRLLYYTNAPSITISSSSIDTNGVYAQNVVLTVDRDYGYWSTNGSGFIELAAGYTNIIISNTTTFEYYAGDGVNTSMTQGMEYRFDVIYVDDSGDDSQDGRLPENALLSIQKAIYLAVEQSITNVYIGAGVYVPGDGLFSASIDNNYSGINISNINDMNIIGGWNETFSVRDGYSRLDGAGASRYHVLWITNSTNMMIDGFEILNGNASEYPNDNGGGIFMKNVYNSLITNCIVSNNSAIKGGGGIILNYCAFNTLSATIIGNNALNGGGMYLWESDYNTINCIVKSNSAVSNAGGIALAISHINILNGELSGNTAAEFGGGAWFLQSTNNTINGIIYGNYSDFCGGGVALGASTNIYFSASCVITNNEAGSFGGGVFNASTSENNTTNVLTTIVNNWVILERNWFDQP